MVNTIGTESMTHLRGLRRSELTRWRITVLEEIIGNRGKERSLVSRTRFSLGVEN